jgi:hypothetical protein
MSQLTATFLMMLFGPMAVALVVLGIVVLLEKREARIARHLQPPQPSRSAPPPPRTRRPALTLVRN